MRPPPERKEQRKRYEWATFFFTSLPRILMYISEAFGRPACAIFWLLLSSFVSFLLFFFRSSNIFVPTYEFVSVYSFPFFVLFSLFSCILIYSFLPFFPWFSFHLFSTFRSFFCCITLPYSLIEHTVDNTSRVL
jgi:hypothetical protein